MKNYKLEFIRGIAAILVFICHLFVSNSKLQGIDFGLISNWGTESVIIFFILSGLVIAKSCEGRNITIKQFIFKRLIRLYPLLLISLMFAYIITYFLFNENIIGNIFLLGTLDANIFPVPNGNIVIWSLSFEIFFYIIFGVILYFKNFKLLLAWYAISILLIPLYYSSTNSIFDYLISHLVFSCPWLFGFFLNKYSKKLNYFTLGDTLFFVALLPAIARLKITSEFYCIIKYDMFALVSLPLFIFANNYGNKIIKIKYDYIKYIIFSFIYVIISLSLIYFSDSRKMAKIIYLLLPLAIYLITPFIIYVLNRTKNIFHELSL